MAAYLVAAIDIDDRDAYREYVRRAVATFKAAGGEALAISDDAAVLEGDRPGGRIVLIRFPSQAALQQWYDSDVYRDVRALRFAAASTPFLLSVDGTEE